MPDRSFLFLAGLGRSGTTVLAELFSAHPEIAIGMERHKWSGQFPDWRLTPEAFTRERFFDFEDGLTNIRPDVAPRWAEYYAALEDRWDEVRYVGDKITHLRFRQIWEGLPDARVLCIIRNVRDVAASWQVRADNPTDVAWSVTRGAKEAVEPWNRGLRSVLRARREHPGQVALVEYDHLYGDPSAAALRAALAWLDLSWSDEMGAAFDAVHLRYVSSIAPKERTLTAEAAAYIDEHANAERWKRALRHAL